MTTVLLCDDERDLLSVLDFNLRAAGFETILATRGEEALLALKRRVPDLVLLDLMLPDLPGTEICRRIKSDPRTRHVPVVMLTAKGEEVDRVVGFELGADDYVTKPFSVRELVLRLKAVLRRAGAGPGKEQLRERVGPIRVDAEAHRAFVDGGEIELTPLEFRLLSTFMSRLGRVQSREQLLEDVWEMSPDVETRTVDTHVKRLREKLGAGRDLLETVRGIGYRMVDPAEEGTWNPMAIGRTPLSAAIKALRAELASGPHADLGQEVSELGGLLLQRELRRFASLRDPVEQELLASLPDAAAVVAVDGRVRVCNGAFDALSAGGRAAGLTILEVTRSGELAEAVRRALEGTARRIEVELQHRVLSVLLTPLLRGEVLSLARDVTEERRAAATRRDFVANASHELRTPVAAIRGAAETLLAGALDEPESAHHFVEIVHRQAERLSRLTQDLLDLSRLESRQVRFEVAPVELAALGRQVAELHGLAARKKGLELRVELPEGLQAMADGRALEQVLVNLVDNAIKYTPSGSVELRAQAHRRDVLITVTDTGPGIEAHHLARVFERFYRVDPGRAREAGGTGLGLAIAKHLVQGMHGEIGVESGAAGTCFTVRLPAAGTARG